MKPKTNSLRSCLLYTVGGMVLGGLVLHTYSMIVCRLTMSNDGMPGISELVTLTWQCLQPKMWPMAAFYLIMGGFAGYGVHRLIQAREELVRRQATHETLENLTLTVAHHIRNANSSVGGYTRRLLSGQPDPETARKLQVVLSASSQIEAVVTALQTLDEKTETEEIGTTHLRMININEMIAQKMESLNLKQPA